MGIDVWEVIEAADQFSAIRLSTLAGLGGTAFRSTRCICRKRQYGRPTRFIELAAEINTFMPEYVVMRVGSLE